MGNVIQVSSSRPRTRLRKKYSTGPMSRMYRTMSSATQPKDTTGTPSKSSARARSAAAARSSLSIVPTERTGRPSPPLARFAPPSRSTQSQNAGRCEKSVNGARSRSNPTTVTRPRP